MANQQDILRQLVGLIEETKTEEKTYGRDLIAEAKKGRFSPIIGRESVIEEVLEVLLQHRKGNPVLLGPAGVGKTAIVEALAQLLYRAGGKLPGILKNANLIEISVGEFVAGAGVVGELEKRFTDLMNQHKGQNIILFIDEVHMLIGAGAGGRSQNDLANLLKPYLARDDIRLIGVTTEREFDTIIATDAALERRFCKVYVEPLDEDSTTAALAVYAKYRNVKVATNFDLAMITERSLIVQPNRSLPDSAIELFDRASALMKLHGIEQLSEDLVDKAAKRISGLPLDINERLDQMKIEHPKITTAIESLYKLVNGTTKKRCPITIHESDIDQAEKLVNRLSSFLGGRVDIDVCSETKPEIIGSPPGSTGYGEYRALWRLFQFPYCVLFVRGAGDIAPENLNLFNKLCDSGKITDARGRDIKPVLMVITGSVLGKKTMGFAPN
jgi:ATP-dependent Clp protease ATP-binding subunit ClpA